MKKLVFITLLLLTTLACGRDEREIPEGSTSEKSGIFEESKWKTKVGKDYPYRDLMLEDLMNNQGLRTLKRPEILERLGEPDRLDTNYLFYRVEQQRIGLWPLHTKTMVIHLKENDSVKWVKIHE